MPIKAITFDFWSTLYRSRPVKYERRLLKLQRLLHQYGGRTIPEPELKTAIQSTWAKWDVVWEQEQRTFGAAQWLTHLVEDLNFSLDDLAHTTVAEHLENALLENPPILIEEMRAVLDDLVTDYQLGIISDTGMTPGRILRQILETDEIIDYFEHLTFSDELGHSKPHPEAFLSTLTALNAEPESGVHVGDLLRTDISGAQGVGMYAVQYVGVHQDDSLPITADAVIDNHTQLRSWLKQWQA